MIATLVKLTKNPAMKKDDGEYQVTEADVLQFFDTIQKANSFDEVLAILANSEHYKSEAKKLTKTQRRNVRQFAQAMQQCQ